VTETPHVLSSWTVKTKLEKQLLSKSDSKSISELSTGIVVCVGLNDKHSHRKNLE